MTDASAFARGGDRGRCGSTWPAVGFCKSLRTTIPVGHASVGMLPEAERMLLKSWVLSGAHWPDGAEGVLAESPEPPQGLDRTSDAAAEWWSYQPLARRSMCPRLQSSSDAIDLLDEHLAALGLVGADVASGATAASCQFRFDWLATDTGRGPMRLPWLGVKILRQPGPRKLIVCWIHRPTASTGPDFGWTKFGSRKPTVTNATAQAEHLAVPRLGHSCFE